MIKIYTLSELEEASFQGYFNAMKKMQERLNTDSVKAIKNYVSRSSFYFDIKGNGYTAW